MNLQCLRSVSHTEVYIMSIAVGGVNELTGRLLIIRRLLLLCRRGDKVSRRSVGVWRGIVVRLFHYFVFIFMNGWSTCFSFSLDKFFGQMQRPLR